MAAKDWADADLQPLLDRNAAGDQSAAGELIVRLQGRLEREIAIQIKGKIADNRHSEKRHDVFGDVVKRLLTAIPAVKPETPEKLLGLAYRHVGFAVKDMLKHHHGPQGSGKHPMASLAQPAVSEASARLVPEPADPGVGPATEVGNRDLIERMRAALPPEQREVFDLVTLGEMSVEEAARQLSVSPSTVERLRRAALKRLGRMKEALGAG